MKIPTVHHARIIISILGSCFIGMCGFCAEPAQDSGEASASTSPANGGALGNMSLEELLKVKVQTQSTTSRVDEKIDESPGSVYVYPREIIQDRGYRSLGELLQTVPGFTVFHRDLQYVVGVRGLNANDNDKVSVLVNGQRILGLHEQEFLNGPINLDNVERVEVVVGPSSLFQQADTLAATINVITKVVDGVEAVNSFGNELKYSETLMAGHHWAPDKFVSLSFTTEAKRGFDGWNPDFRPGLAGRSVTGELDWPSFFSVLNGQYGEWTMQAVAYRSSLPELNIDSGSALNNAEMTEQYYSFLLKDEHPWSDTLMSVTRFDVAYKDQTRLNMDVTPIDANQQEIHQMLYEGEIGLRYTGFQHQVIQAGVQASYANTFSNFTYNNTNPFVNIPPTTVVNQATTAVGFYLDDNIQVTQWLRLIEGVRIDENGVLNGDRWYPGARSAIIVDPTSFWVSKLIYNRAVRMPDAMEALNQVFGSSHVNNPDDPTWAQTSPVAQDPEILTTYELQNIFYFGKVRFGTAIYHEELEDFISWFSPHSNGGNFRGNGVELTLQAPINTQLSIWANGAWNDSYLDLFNPTAFGPPGVAGPTESFHSYVNPEGRLIGSAAFTANLGLDWKILEHLTFSPSVQYFTEQAGVDFEPSPSQPVFTTIRNRYYLDAGLKWDHVWNQDMDLRLALNNILNNRQPVASQQNGDTYQPRGITVVVTLDLRF
jgi:outer membrane receptor protein involved in Fe transport